MDVSDFIKNFNLLFGKSTLKENPWDLIKDLPDRISYLIKNISLEEYFIRDNIAIHKNAIVEDFAILKNFVIVEEGATVKSGAYLRDGVYIGKHVNIGANCEIKQSIIFNFSRIAHLNYVGNSIVGEDVNIEAGAVLANHFNEKENKEIEVIYQGKRIETGVTKFGSLIGDGVRIGANAVLNPGTILAPRTIVGRLEHINQLK